MTGESSIEYLALSGGGCKGMVYSGMLKALEETNTISGVKHVSGTSAGATTAALIACGITSPELKRILQDKLSEKLGEGWFRDKIDPYKDSLS